MKLTPDSTQEHCTVEHLARIFGQCRDEVVEEWRHHTKELLHALSLDHATLTDHVPDIVDEIIHDLSLQPEGRVPKEKTPGSHPRHGVQRVTDGLNIGQVVAEYNLLRDAFFTVADHHDLYLVGEAARIISNRIDAGVRAAVTAFAAQQASNLKAREEEHLAFIAHDLRTPINAIGLLIEELKMTCEENATAEYGETFVLLKRNLQRLSNQINQVLAGHSNGPATEAAFQPQRRVFELWPLVQGLILDFRSIAAKENVNVVNQIPYLLTVCADAALISQVFQNLLSNAFKHSPDGQVTISAAVEAGSVTCRVQDTGRGIPAEMLTPSSNKLSRLTTAGSPWRALPEPVPVLPLPCLPR
jgi:two-component system, OmpR family, phosphate regulon sensor histidine kinase PhoR